MGPNNTIQYTNDTTYMTTGLNRIFKMIMCADVYQNSLKLYFADIVLYLYLIHH